MKSDSRVALQNRVYLPKGSSNLGTLGSVGASNLGASNLGASNFFAGREPFCAATAAFRSAIFSQNSTRGLELSYSAAETRGRSGR